jgi:hypothetical protein
VKFALSGKVFQRCSLFKRFQDYFCLKFCGEFSSAFLFHDSKIKICFSTLIRCPKKGYIIKTDPTFSTIEKIAKALGIELSKLFKADEVFKEVNSYDKTLLEKLEEKEKQAFYSIMDAFIFKKILKDALSNAIDMVL